MAFAEDDASDDEDENENETAEASPQHLRPTPDVAIPTTVAVGGGRGAGGSSGSGGTSACRPLAVDFATSDLWLDVDERGVARAAHSLPDLWVLGRGSRAAYAGRNTWHLRIRTLPPDSRPSLLFGWLAVPPGSAPLPGPVVGEQAVPQPSLTVAADTGAQLFTSNRSGALLCKPLLQRPLAEGDLIEARLDLLRRRVFFRVNRGALVEASRLPSLQPRGRNTSFRQTAHYPFFALRAGMEVELLEDSSLGAPPPAVAPMRAEVTMLVGPPGAGKTTWAFREAAGKPTQIIGAELLHHRFRFSSALDESGGVVSATDAALAESISALIDEAAAAAEDVGAEEEEDEIEGEDEESEEEEEEHGKEKELEELGVEDEDGDAELRMYLQQALRGAEEAAVLGPEGASGAAAPPATGAEAPSPLPCGAAGEGADADCPRLFSLAREVVAEHEVELLTRALDRGCSVILDDCHLHAARRAELRAALARAVGRARWVVALPQHEKELWRRRSARGTPLSAPDRPSGAGLPGLGGDGGPMAATVGGVRVEFAEGSDPSVFHAWRRSCGSSSGGGGKDDSSEVCGDDADAAAPPGTSSGSLIQGFFNSLGGSEAFLSTEGLRR